MDARYTVYLRQSARGWEWARHADSLTWWGWYKQRGHATAAAKRSITRVPGSKTNPHDFDFVEVAI